MPEEKKVRGNKKKQQKEKKDPKKLEVLDDCRALGDACNWVGDVDDTRRYCKRAKEGYEEQLRRESKKALDSTCGLIMVGDYDGTEKTKKLRDLVKRMERALGMENEVTFGALDQFGNVLSVMEEYEEEINVYGRCLARQTQVYGGYHKGTLGTLNNLGNIYNRLMNDEKALEYYERALK